MKGLFSILVGALIFFSACSDDDNKEVNLKIRLTDSPADYEEVLIDIEEVRVQFDSNGDWITLDNVEAGIYNLLDFTNGTDTLLVDATLPEGTISQIRLVLGDENSVKIDGQYYDIKTPSAQQTGLKLNVHADLVSGITYKMWIDFDAGRSIVHKGNGSYSLKPVIRTFTEATSGGIKGMINPVESYPYIMAISESLDTFSTYADTASGYFLIRALPEGTYSLDVEPVEMYQEKEIEDISVSTGEVTDVGEITLDEIISMQ